MSEQPHKETDLDVEQHLDDLVSGPLAKLQLHAPAATQPRTTLLSLAAELRNKIYRLASVHDDEIKINESTYTLPGLVRTNRQLYRETYIIFTKENRFTIEIVDLKPPIPIDFSHHWLRHAFHRLSVTYSGNKTDWANLVEWLREWHHTVYRKGVIWDSLMPGVGRNTLYTIRCVLAEYGDLVMISDAREIVRTMRDSPWDLIDCVLDHYKSGTEMAGYQWT